MYFINPSGWRATHDQTFPMNQKNRIVAGSNMRSWKDEVSQVSKRGPQVRPKSPTTPDVAMRLYAAVVCYNNGHREGNLCSTQGT
ncbi:hypothetical protein TNCV_3984991 [Trichonephila clavipes]|nr:hypothetical protein TNCV_3984991 [Trichonephila clavipes]